MIKGAAIAEAFFFTVLGAGILIVLVPSFIRSVLDFFKELF